MYFSQTARSFWCCGMKLKNHDKILQVEFENDTMKEKRETLTGLLMNLMNQREERQVWH